MKPKRAKPTPRIPTRQDRILEFCRAHYGPCPVGCAKDGAPNCHWTIGNRGCPPAIEYYQGQS